MTALEPIRYQLGQKGSRRNVNTPNLLLDLDAFTHNVATMATTISQAGKRLRPHFKSHKCPRIASAQMAAGAVGICCATLDEAEIAVANGLAGILLTSPITSADKILRLTRLLQKAPETQVVVDNVENVQALAQAARAAGVVVPVLLDIEIGFGRTGVVDADQAQNLAGAIRVRARCATKGCKPMAAICNIPRTTISAFRCAPKRTASSKASSNGSPLSAWRLPLSPAAAPAPMRSTAEPALLPRFKRAHMSLWMPNMRRLPMSHGKAGRSRTHCSCRQPS